MVGKTTPNSQCCCWTQSSDYDPQNMDALVPQRLVRRPKLCSSTSQHQLFDCSHSTGISVQPFLPQMQEPTKCWLNMIDLQKNGLSDPLEHLLGAICISNYQIPQTSCHIFWGSIKIYCE